MRNWGWDQMGKIVRVQFQQLEVQAFLEAYNYIFEMQIKENHIQEISDVKARKTYLKYTKNMRLQLIKLVEEEKIPTAQAARLVGIKQTSACRIMNSYRKYNRIFERKADRMLRQTKQALENSQKKHQIQKKSKQKKVGTLQATQTPESMPNKQKQCIKIEQSQNSRPLEFLSEIQNFVNMTFDIGPNLQNIQNNWNMFMPTPICNWPLYYQFY